MGVLIAQAGARVSPVTSDIIAGMRWAAVLAVPGAPSNTNPARVLNLSLGGEGVCTMAYRDAVAEINAVGAVVVAAAGNSVGHAVGTPANCPGVIAVAGLRHVGTKVGFSELGPEISINAPAGNCVNTAAGTPCLYPILTTSNAGLTTPIADADGGSIYTGSFKASVGTTVWVARLEQREGRGEPVLAASHALRVAQGVPPNTISLSRFCCAP